MSGKKKGGGNSLMAIFAAPLLIALFSTVGLIAALTGDGLRDLISWIGLTIPVAAVIWAMWARRS